MPHAKPPLRYRFFRALLNVVGGFVLMACSIPFLNNDSVVVQLAVGLPLLATGTALITLVFGTWVQWNNWLYPPKK